MGIAEPNVLVLDEPTNHLDLESIEALVEGLKKYEGTLILVSHDRWFVSQLATRIVEIKPDDILDYQGTYEEYVHFCGDDHLDADRVVLKARKEAGKKKGEGKENGRSRGQEQGANGKTNAEQKKKGASNGSDAGAAANNGANKKKKKYKKRVERPNS